VDVDSLLRPAAWKEARVRTGSGIISAAGIKADQGTRARNFAAGSEP